MPHIFNGSLSECVAYMNMINGSRGRGRGRGWSGRGRWMRGRGGRGNGRGYQGYSGSGSYWERSKDHQNKQNLTYVADKNQVIDVEKEQDGNTGNSQSQNFNDVEMNMTGTGTVVPNIIRPTGYAPFITAVEAEQIVASEASRKVLHSKGPSQKEIDADNLAVMHQKKQRHERENIEKSRK